MRTADGTDVGWSQTLTLTLTLARTLTLTLTLALTLILTIALTLTLTRNPSPSPSPSTKPNQAGWSETVEWQVLSKLYEESTASPAFRWQAPGDIGEI